MSDMEIAEAARPFFDEEKIWRTMKRLRMLFPSCAAARAPCVILSQWEALFFKLPEYEPSLLVWQKSPLPLREIAEILNEASNALREISLENFIRENLTVAVAGMIGAHQRGEVLWPLRVALSGQAASPDPIEIMGVIGKEESLKRIEIAIQACSKFNR